MSLWRVGGDVSLWTCSCQALPSPEKSLSSLLLLLKNILSHQTDNRESSTSRMLNEEHNLKLTNHHLMFTKGVTERNHNHWDFPDGFSWPTPWISQQRAAVESFLLNNWGVFTAWTLWVKTPSLVPATVLGCQFCVLHSVQLLTLLFLVLLSTYLFSFHYIKCIYVQCLNSLLEHGGVKNNRGLKIK